jgi:outer membrane immunogenic protein
MELDHFAVAFPSQSTKKIGAAPGGSLTSHPQGIKLPTRGKIFMNRNKLLLSAAFFLAGIGSAGAADLLPPTYDSDWTGLYATLSAGYAEVSVDGRQIDPEFGNKDDSDTSGGAIFGFGVGYNLDFGSFVVGPEADIGMLTNDGQLNMKDSVDADYDWFATGRLRAGVDLDGTLLYATGGVAGLNAEFNDRNENDSQGVTFWGWTVGGGVEHMISERLSVRLEGLYAEFESEDFTLGDIDTKIDPKDLWLVRAGVSLRF